MKEEVKRIIEAGIIKPIESDWSSPVVLGTKKDGSLRFCVDYRRLNDVMKRNRWQIPRVDEIFEEIKGSTVFTAIDIFQSYWQIKMDGACKEMTMFLCIYGTFRF